MPFEWLLQQEGFFLYLCVFLTLLGGAFFLPFPEDLILICVGIIINQELANPYILIPLAYTTAILGDIILYGMGYYFGINLFKKRWFRNKIHPQKIRNVSAHLNENFLMAIFLGRHLFYLRSITFLVTGAVRMSFVRFVIADAIAGLISCAVMVSIGYFAANNFRKISKYLDKTENIIGIILIIIILVFAWKLSRKTKEKNS